MEQESPNVQIVVPMASEEKVLGALREAGSIILRQQALNADEIEISAVVPSETLSGFGAWLENFRAGAAAEQPSLLSRRLIASGLLVVAVGWIIFDWIAVGSAATYSVPFWKEGSVRMPLLMAASVMPAWVPVSIAGFRPELARVRILFSLIGGTLMWACCIYTLRRCYEYQHTTGHSGSWWKVTIVVVVLPVVVADATMRVWTRLNDPLRDRAGGINKGLEVTT